IQVAEEISKIGKFKEVKTLPIYGGQPIERQIHALKKGVQIVIGTPGRILDHLNRKTLILNNVKMVVL
ncbi:DEAD/DEAH box helicase, partial [Carboxydocella sp. JDF658]